MLPIVAMLVHLQGSTAEEFAASECLHDGRCLGMPGEVVPEGWMSPLREAREQAIKGLHHHLSSDVIERLCLEKDSPLNCTVRNQANPHPKWSRLACENEDLWSCGRYALDAFPFAEPEERLSIQELALDGCRRGSPLACAAYAEHVRESPSAGDKQTAIAWASLGCTWTRDRHACVVATRWMEDLGDEESAAGFRQFACDPAKGDGCDVKRPPVRSIGLPEGYAARLAENLQKRGGHD